MQNIGQRPFITNMPPITRVIVVIAVLGIALLASLQPKAIYLAIPFGVAGLALLLARPQLGFLAMIAGSLMVPFSIGTGSESSLHFGRSSQIIQMRIILIKAIDPTSRTTSRSAHQPAPAPAAASQHVYCLRNNDVQCHRVARFF